MTRPQRNAYGAIAVVAPIYGQLPIAQSDAARGNDPRSCRLVAVERR